MMKVKLSLVCKKRVKVRISTIKETALSAFMRMAQRKNPAAIIVTGDLTFNGERVSAERFAEIFKPLKKTKVLVLPGNHDVFDGWAREFSW